MYMYTCVQEHVHIMHSPLEKKLYTCVYIVHVYTYPKHTEKVEFYVQCTLLIPTLKQSLYMYMYIYMYMYVHQIPVLQ